MSNLSKVYYIQSSIPDKIILKIYFTTPALLVS